MSGRSGLPLVRADAHPPLTLDPLPSVVRVMVALPPLATHVRAVTRAALGGELLVDLSVTSTLVREERDHGTDDDDGAEFDVHETTLLPSGSGKLMRSISASGYLDRREL